MRILLFHNRYQLAGGEDSVVRAETALLKSRGVEVCLVEADNDAITGLGSQVAAAANSFYSRQSRRRVEQAVCSFRPDVAHAHNLFPVLSSSVLYACAAAGVPVVQTVHNYRLLCPNGLLFRDGSVCEDCLGKPLAWPGILHGCYRGSRAGTLVAAAATAAHRAIGTYETKVSLYIALTEFSRRKLVEGGLPAQRIVVKPNFLDIDPRAGDGDGGYVLFVGRITSEKGINVLLRAWKKLGRGISLKIIGTGPLVPEIAAAAHPNVEYLGSKSPEDVYDYMGRAMALVLPSECFESFPRTIVESFAKGTPVIASRLGSMQEIVEHRRTGLHFTCSDPEALVEQIEWMLSHPVEWLQMRRECRAEFEKKYSAERNYSLLAGIYERAIAET
jgi:glycosyltransferase involved in cell wall biosynthesis